MALPNDGRLALCLALLAAVSSASAQTEKPGRIAIGMLQGDQMPSVTVEITTDGWVQLNLLATRVDGGVQPPSMRLIVEPRDVRAWATQVRGMMKTRQDPAKPPEQHLLGNGNYQLNVTHLWRDTTDNLYFAWRACGSGWGSGSPSGAEVAKLVDLLDSAAVEAGSGSLVHRHSKHRTTRWRSPVRRPASQVTGFPSPGLCRRQNECRPRSVSGSCSTRPGTSSRDRCVFCPGRRRC